MPTTILPYICIFLIGLAVGGFVNVCVDRFPKKISFLKAPFCEKCEAKISWHDMIPLVSFLLLKGRCRSCGAKVQIQYPIVELANGVLYVIVFMANGQNLTSLLYCLMSSAFLVISIVDERTLEIPFACNVLLGILGIIHLIFDLSNFPLYLLGMVCVGGALFLLYQISRGTAIGGGDVYLMFAAGLLLGWKKATLAFFLACIIGSIIHVIRMKVSGAERVLAMGPYLCLGLWICALWGDEMIQWYLGLIGH